VSEFASTYECDLGLSRVVSLAQKRVLAEKKKGLVCVSSFTQTAVSLAASGSFFEDLASRHLAAGATAYVLPTPPAPRLVLCTDRSIAVSWDPLHASSPASAEGTAAPAYLMIRYELAMMVSPVAQRHLPTVVDDAHWEELGSSCIVYRGCETDFQVEHLGPNQSYAFRVRAFIGSAPSTGRAGTCGDVCSVGEWSEPLVQSTRRNYPIKFVRPPLPARSASSSPIFVSSDGQQITFGGNERWQTVMAEEGFVGGVNEWTVRIDSSSTAYMFVGVAKKGVDLDSFLGSDDRSWGFIGDRALYYKRTKVKSYGERFGEGDEVR
jgi:hypothetical protein